MIKLIVFYYIIINIYGLFIMRIDKQRARRNKYRIPEKTLWLVSLFGGAFGTTIGMHVHHHKTKHLSFKIGFPALVVAHLIVLYLILTNLS